MGMPFGIYQVDWFTMCPKLSIVVGCRRMQKVEQLQMFRPKFISLCLRESESFIMTLTEAAARYFPFF